MYMIFGANFWTSVIEFFQSIGRAIQVFWNYLTTVIANLVTAMVYLSTSQQSVTVVMGFMPILIGGACLAFIAIAILRFFLMK